MARKPLGAGTVAANVLTHGTGALNIDGCRVGVNGAVATGRFPANLIHDGSDEVCELFPNTGKSSGGGGVKTPGKNGIYGKFNGHEYGDTLGFGDSGSTARFFYSAKVSKKERNAGLPEGMINNHPTLKPISLMRYLCRLVTPPGGIVLDPFMGSGSTGVAALNEGFKFVGCELSDEYFKIATERISHADSKKKEDILKESHKFE